jgi:hypothetical protein
MFSVAGERLNQKVVWQMIQQDAEAAGIPRILPHDNRGCAKLQRAAILSGLNCSFATYSMWRSLGTNPASLTYLLTVDDPYRFRRSRGRGCLLRIATPTSRVWRQPAAAADYKGRGNDGQSRARAGKALRGQRHGGKTCVVSTVAARSPSRIRRSR